MVSKVCENTPGSILTRTVAAGNDDWTEEVARAFMSLSISPADVERMNALAKLAQAGELSQGQEVEIENYRQAGRLLELLKAKARVFLAQPAVRTA